jgi:putative NADH-flavin reductase
MNIAVIGANGRTGRIVVRDALARGHQVVAVTRADGVSERGDDNLTNVRADVHDANGLRRALVGADAIISALGVGTTRAPTDVYSVGVRHTLAAMDSNRAGKLAVVSAVPVGPWADQPLLQRRIALPLLQRFFGATYDDMRRMETILQETTEVEWISLRPPRLVSKRPKGAYPTPARWQRRAPSPTATSPQPSSTRSRVRISTGTPRTLPISEGSAHVVQPAAAPANRGLAR